jgi:thioredoxin-dependent peroxiredoxin
LCDTEREIGMAYGACDSRDAGAARRISYLIAPDGTIAQAWEKVRPKDHPAEVLGAF